MKIIVLLVLLSHIIGCTTMGDFDDSGYHHDRANYSVYYMKPSKESFLPPTWFIEKNRDGNPIQPDAPVRVGEFRNKHGSKSQIRYKALNLLFEHKTTNGIISVVSFPLRETERIKKLNILAKNFANSLSGSYHVSASFDGHFAVGASSRWASQIIKQQSVTKGSREIHDVTIQLYNSDQLKVNPNHKDKKIRLVFVRAQADYGWTELGEASLGVYAGGHFPALVVIGYSMDHDYFDEFEPDFNRFLKQIKFH
ncbi:MAG: hypothetical protein HRU19_25965 [Pseudobacteriovorax sp.]|nr:hypothetical protein [Pseudobacteriovorax sp.]